MQWDPQESHPLTCLTIIAFIFVLDNIEVQ